jgi:hypothetical protein
MAGPTFFSLVGANPTGTVLDNRTCIWRIFISAMIPFCADPQSGRSFHP